MASTNPKDYKVVYTDKFFFDTNIWLLLYGTIADFQKQDQKQYSAFLAEILSRGSSIYVSSIIISEFANVLLRKDFKQWVHTNKLIDQDYKKNFVGISEYTNSVSIVSNLINKILKLPGIIPLSDNFSSMDIIKVLKNFEKIDFNDSYILELSEEKDLILVTNDKDFLKVSSSLTIITT